MDDAKKLLDSLMGQTRNLELKEAKKRKGNNFKEASACKFYLLGFCPQYEQLFRNTKRHLGECSLIHSEALKLEFENHSERVDYERKYVRDLVRYMEGIVRTADEAVSRQARNIQMANKDLEERGPNDVAKREIEKIRENCNLLLNEAEELAEKGDIEGSKTKQAIFEQTKQKADEYEAKSKQPIKEEVCEICGLRPEDGDGMRKFSHTEGKIHIGFMKVREWLKKMRAKADEFEDRHVGLKGDKKDRSKSRDRKRRSRSRRDPQTDQLLDQPKDRGDRKDKDDRKDREDKKDKVGDEETKDKEPAKGDGEPAASNGEKADADADKEQPRDKDTKEPAKERDEPTKDRDRGRDTGGDRAEASSRRRGGDRDQRGGGDRDERGSRGGGDRRGDRGNDGDRYGGRGDRDRGDRGGDRGERRQRSRSRDRRRH